MIFWSRSPAFTSSENYYDANWFNMPRNCDEKESSCLWWRHLCRGLHIVNEYLMRTALCGNVEDIIPRGSKTAINFTHGDCRPNCGKVEPIIVIVFREELTHMFPDVLVVTTSTSNERHSLWLTEPFTTIYINKLLQYSTAHVINTRYCV